MCEPKEYAGLAPMIQEISKAVAYLVERVAGGMPDEGEVEASSWHEFVWEDGLQDAYNLVMADPYLRLLKPAIYAYAVKMIKLYENPCFVENDEKDNK